jgi:hypothetical protein
MANGRGGRKKADTGRDAGGFVALPWSVLDSPSYARLGHPARALLMEFARQFVRDNNGRLLASFAYLSKRGWTSADVISRAKRELLEAGFIFETVKGHRPNKASWYAVTWRDLDRHSGYDVGASGAFERGAYRRCPLEADEVLRPRDGAVAASIEPSAGTVHPAPVPSRGAIRSDSKRVSMPPHGNHLEMPSSPRSQPLKFLPT